MKKFALRLPKELHEVLKEMAKSGESMNSLIIHAIENFLKKGKK